MPKIPQKCSIGHGVLCAMCGGNGCIISKIATSANLNPKIFKVNAKPW